MNIGTTDQYRQLSIHQLIFPILMCFSNLILFSPTESFINAPRSLITNNSLIQNKIRPSLRESYTSNHLKEICNYVKSTNLTNLPFGTIGTICKLRLNKTARKNNRTRRKIVQNRINM